MFITPACGKLKVSQLVRYQAVPGQGPRQARLGPRLAPYAVLYIDFVLGVLLLLKCHQEVVEVLICQLVVLLVGDAGRLRRLQGLGRQGPEDYRTTRECGRGNAHVTGLALHELLGIRRADRSRGAHLKSSTDGAAELGDVGSGHCRRKEAVESRRWFVCLKQLRLCAYC